MREEFPRPDFKVDSFISLHGEWDFDFDDDNVGKKEKWFLNHKYSKKINVPFCFQSELSGICDNKFHDRCYYHKSFKKPLMKEDEELLLHLEGVDYYSEVYLNGFLLKTKYSANCGYIVNLTTYLKEDNDLVIYVEDPSTDRSIPRGKQDWEEKSHGIFYTRTTGIYKPIWLEVANKIRVKNFYINTKLENYTISIDLETTAKDIQVLFKVKNNNDIKEFIFDVKKEKDTYVFNLPNDYVNERVWSLTKPFLFDLDIVLLKRDRKTIYKCSTYFGIREVKTKDRYVTINNEPIYLKLVLNQGYYPKGVLTAKDIETLNKDIDLMKEMGFNGCRIHQKCEDPYFLYLCDKKGFLIWQECASNYGFNNYSQRRMLNEWIDIVKTNYNHPSIIAFTPLNESWGVEGIPFNKQMQAFAMSLYYLIHSLDDSRLVISNDGWEQVKTDLLTIHNYDHGQKGDKEKYNKYKKALSSTKEILKFSNINRFILCAGFTYENQPIILSEFGGIAFKSDTNDGKNWGYTTCNSKEEYYSELKRLYDAIKKSNCISGICYTQLTDVEQEVNGLLTFNREYKIDPKLIKDLNDSLEVKILEK